MEHQLIVRSDGSVFDPLSAQPKLDDIKRQMQEEAALRLTAAAMPKAAPPPVEPPETPDVDTGLPVPEGTTAIERWEEVNLLAFEDFLVETKNISPQTRKTYKQALRRLMRDFPLPALKDPTALQAYRTSMKLGTRNTFDASWPCIARFMVGYGISMPLTTPSKPRIRFAHPLASDLMTIGGMMNYALIPTMTWRQMLASGVVDMPTLQACRRICEFQTGLDYGLPVKDEFLDAPLIPASAKLDPMPEWRIRWIVDSERDVTGGPIEQASAEFFQKLAALGVNGFRLRKLSYLYCLTRNTVKRHRFSEKTLANILSLVHPLKLSELEARLTELGGELETPPLW